MAPNHTEHAPTPLHHGLRAIVLQSLIHPAASCYHHHGAACGAVLQNAGDTAIARPQRTLMRRVHCTK